MITRFSAVLACFAFLSACGGSSGGSSPPPPPPPPTNTAPVVDAGLDATIRLPVDAVDLDGTVSDDGQPAGAGVSTAWTVSSGPAGATFADPNAVDTTVTFVSDGTYVLELSANDTALTGSDTVTVIVEAAPAVDSIAVTPPTISLAPGAIQAFSASGTDQYGAPIAVSETWSATGGTIDAAGNYTAGTTPGAFIVTATDGAVSGTANVTISSSPPTAVAGGPYVGVQGAAIGLDGSGSTDANNDIVSYDWDLDNDGLFDDATGVNPTFAAAGTGVFTIGLQVTDADGASDTDTTTVTVTNVAPIANAGPDQPAVSQGATVTLDGSGSSDPGGDALTYAWSLTTVPAGSAATLSDATAVGPTFDTDLVGSYVAELVVNDGTANSPADTVTITVSNAVPTANAGPDQVVDQGATVTLDGSGSSDPGGDALTYAWSLTTVPVGSAATLSDTTAVGPTFDTDLPGSYVAELVVNDGTADSAADAVTITVNDIAPAAPTGVSASGDDGQVTLDWADNGEPDIAGYHVMRSTTSGGPYTDESGLIVASDYVDGTVANGTTYYYVVTAEDAGANVSVESAEVETTPNGPVHAYWKFDENAGTTTADTILPDDGTGTINDFVAPSWTDGVTGPGADFALDLDGTSDHVVIDNTQSLKITGTAITMTAWIYPRSGGASGGSRVISKRTDAGGNDVFAMIVDQYRLRFRLDGEADMISSHIIELNEWVHVAMVYNGVDKRIYVNGVLDLATPEAKTDPIDTSARAVRLGMREGEARFFDGIMDEVQILNSALTAGQISTMHGAVTPVDPNPGGLTFTDITVSAGTEGPADGGHGVMFAEVDNDSMPDYYLTNNLEGNSNRDDFYFENLTGVTFGSVAATRGINDIDGGSHGAVWADLDNDGDYDLVNGTTWDNANPSRGNPDSDNIFRNDGPAFNGTNDFVDVTPASVTAVEIETRGITAFDMNGDGILDLFGVSGNEVPENNIAFLGDGIFGFTAHVGNDLSTAIGMQGVTDTDYDGDGDIDVFAANRGGDFAILDNDGAGVFTQIVPATLGITDSAGDGIITADVDNDGDLDLLLTSDNSAHLYLRDSGTGMYAKSQSFSATDGYMGGFADLENDGDLDLVFAGDEGVYLNQGNGTFVSGQSVPVSGIADPRAIAFADIDSDGDLDFAIAAKDSRNWLVQNDIDLDAGNYLRVELVSPSGQAGAFGATVSVVPAGGGALIGMREAKGNYGYLGQDDPVLHFGLGATALVDVTVKYVECANPVTVTNQAANTRILVSAACPP